MPELLSFPKGYNYSFDAFNAYVLLPSETSKYTRFRHSDKQSRDTSIKEFTPVFFITTDEATGLLLFDYPLVKQVRDRVPKGGQNRELYDWQLIIDDNLARLVSV